MFPEMEVGMPGRYVVVSGVIFGLVALLQAARALLQLPVQIGSFEIPVWGSWVAALVAGGLCVWAFTSKN
jgi:hypothetical protein